MDNKIKLPDLVKINKKNIKTEVGTVTLKYINIVEYEKTLKEKISNAPHLKELVNLFDDKIHNKIIITCEDIHSGISAVAHIGCCMESRLSKKAVMESSIEFDDVFFDEDENLSSQNEENEQDNFVIALESEIDNECNSIGDPSPAEQMQMKMPKIDYSEFKKLIFVADGLFSLTEKSINFIQGFYGNIAVIIPQHYKNEAAVKQLVFESDFEEFNIQSASNLFLAEQFFYLAKTKGFVIDKNVNVQASIDELKRYRGNKFQEYDLSIYLDKNIKLLNKTKTIKTLIPISKDATLTSTELFNEIIGLEGIKNTILQELYKNIHKREMSEKGCATLPSYKHMAFGGNPGTCKTTMARAVSRLYQENDIVSNIFLECGREDIVGRYLGETSQKVAKIFKMAKGGVIFIDEFGAIISESNDSYGIEALNALVRHMENNPDTMVIFATYPEELERILLVNPGLVSRLSTTISFPDYENMELLEIFKYFSTKSGYTLENGWENIATEYFNVSRKNVNFGNGREARKLFECAVAKLSVELFYNKSKKIDTLSTSAIESAKNELLKNNSNKKIQIGFSTKQSEWRI